MEFSGKTIEEATEEGLKELGLKAEEAEIKIISEPVKGLFGKLKVKAVVDVEKKQKKSAKKAKKETNNDNGEKAVEFIQKVLELMEIEGKASPISDKDRFVIEITSDKSSDVIGYRGEVLDSLQTLAGAIVNKGNEEYQKVVVDCENYRERREETLISLAHKLEAKATEMRREVVLEPMNAMERRIIHTALSESETTTTKSEGKEPNRYVVIVPNDKDEFSKPYNAGRNRGHGKDRNDRGRRKGDRFNGGNKGRSGGVKERKKSTSFSGFGTYLGNSLKDKD